MVKTIDKILLAVLVVFFIGMGAVFISAFNNDDSNTGKLVVKEDSYQGSSDLQAVSDTNREKDDESEDEEKEVKISGSALGKASSAAIAFVGEGHVSDSEIGDEEGYYEIEITLDNGNEVDVHLDENFKVLSAEYEDNDDKD